MVNGGMAETGSWNVAQSFSESKIMEHLRDADDFETIARFGCASFLDEMGISIPLDHQKISGFERLLNCLIKVTNNSMFAMKKEGTKSELIKIKNSLQFIRSNFRSLYYFQDVNGRKLKFLKDHQKYDRLLSDVENFKSEINAPLNKNNLIFIHKEEFNVRDYKDKLKVRMVNRG